MISLCMLYGKCMEIYDKLNDNLKEKINYLIARGLTTLISIVSYYLLRIVIEDYKICTIISWIIAVIFAYFINRGFVFKSKEKKVLKEFVSFISSRLLTLVVELLSMYVLVQLIHINVENQIQIIEVHHQIHVGAHTMMNHILINVEVLAEDIVNANYKFI